MVIGLVVYNCYDCGDRIIRDISDRDNNFCDKCTIIRSINIRYAGKKMTEVFQTVLKELDGYKGIVLNSDDNGNLAPIISKNIVKELKEDNEISKT